MTFHGPRDFDMLASSSFLLDAFEFEVGGLVKVAAEFVSPVRFVVDNSSEFTLPLFTAAISLFLPWP